MTNGGFDSSFATLFCPIGIIRTIPTLVAKRIKFHVILLWSAERFVRINERRLVFRVVQRFDPVTFGGSNPCV